MTTTLPPEIEAAIVGVAITAGRIGEAAARDHARDAITRALADAREAGRADGYARGRHEQIEVAPPIDAAIDAWGAAEVYAARGDHHPTDAKAAADARAALCAAVANEIAESGAKVTRAVAATMRPALSAEEAERLIEAHAIAAVLNPSVNDDPIAYEQEATTRAALLVALTGAGGGR
jgi:hypothetical protein